jgi:hypothetical protein
VCRQPGLWQDVGLEPAAAAATWDRFRAGDPTLSPLQVLGLVVLGDFAARHRLAV